MTALIASIVICTRDRSRMLEDSLADMVNQRLLERSARFEVIVVDDGSTDDTPTVVQRFSDQSRIAVRRISGDGKGLAHARNVGVAAALGEWIAFFDDDQRANPTWLAELLDTAERTGADLVGGPIEVSPPDGAAIGPIIRGIYGELPTRRQRRRGVTPRPGGGNRLVHRRVFDSIGLHDESFAVSEDPDLIARVEAASMRFAWAPRAVVRHVIPLDRLNPETIAAYTTKAGAAQAWVDFKRLGRWRSSRSIAVVLIKLGANAALTLLAVLRQSRMDVIDYRARLVGVRWVPGQDAPTDVVG